MKTTNWLIGLLLAATLALAGCGKSDKAGAGPPKADLSKLQRAFPAPTPQMQQCLTTIATGFRYGQYADAFAALDKLAADPSATEAQKKAVAEFTEQLKKMAAGAAPAPAP